MCGRSRRASGRRRSSGRRWALVRSAVMDPSSAFAAFSASYGLLAIFVVMLVKEIGVPVPVPSDLLMVGAGLQIAAGLDPPLGLPIAPARPGPVGGPGPFPPPRAAGPAIVFPPPPPAR